MQHSSSIHLPMSISVLESKGVFTKWKGLFKGPLVRKGVPSKMNAPFFIFHLCVKDVLFLQPHCCLKIISFLPFYPSFVKDKNECRNMRIMTSWLPKSGNLLYSDLI